MAHILPFRAWRPQKHLVEKVACVPHDTVTRQEAKSIASNNPYCFLHVTRPEIDLDDTVDAYDDLVYRQGTANLGNFYLQGILQQDTKASLYAYELTTALHKQLGVAMLVSVSDYEQNLVCKHEHTRIKPENDRVKNIMALNAHTGTVFLVHRDHEKIDQTLGAITQNMKPDVDFIASDGVRHCLWPITDDHEIATIQQGFLELGPIYIADGHHRSSAAALVARQKRQNKPTGDTPWEHFMAVSFPQRHLKILPYNRVIKDLNHLNLKQFLEHLQKIAAIRSEKTAYLQRGEVGMFMHDGWRTLRFHEQLLSQRDAVKRLDVSLLQDHILQPLLGIDDPRTNDRIDFLGGSRGEKALEEKVLRDNFSVAFLMYPTDLDDLLTIADEGRVMPPKSTWFAPKLYDGLLVHRLL